VKNAFFIYSVENCVNIFSAGFVHAVNRRYLYVCS